MAVTNGIISFIDTNGRFAYLGEADGSSVRIPGNLEAFGELKKGSRVMLQYDNEFVKGEYKKGATKLLTIDSPFEPITALCTIVRTSEKGFAFANCDSIKGDIFVPAKLFSQAEVKPGRGMPVLLTVEETVKGFSATELRWKPEELAQYSAVSASMEGALKHFIRKGMYGHVIVDGNDLFFHVNGIKDKDIRKSMLAGSIPNGSVLGFTVGKHQGRPVALITSVVSLAEAVSEAAEESVADEVAQVPAETAVETNVEVVEEAAPAKPKRAARKPKAAKPEVEVAPKPKKPAAKKQNAAKPDADTPVVTTADLPDGPMAEQLAALGLGGTGQLNSAGVTTH